MSFLLYIGFWCPEMYEKYCAPTNSFQKVRGTKEILFYDNLQDDTVGFFGGRIQTTLQTITAQCLG